MKIKICGMREPANIAEIAALRPDYLGFIFYEKSPRFAGEMSEESLDTVPEGVRRVGVFVDATEEYIREMTEKYGLDLLQLHGSESAEFCRRMRDFRPVIKAFGIETADDIRQAERSAGACDYLLFDTKTSARGGSGRAFDHALLTAYTGETPYFLSGGLGAADAGRLAAFDDPRCAAVDINSRFETAPGVKDAALVKTFIETLKNP